MFENVFSKHLLMIKSLFFRRRIESRVILVCLHLKIHARNPFNCDPSIDCWYTRGHRSGWKEIFFPDAYVYQRKHRELKPTHFDVTSIQRCPFFLLIYLVLFQARLFLARDFKSDTFETVKHAFADLLARKCFHFFLFSFFFGPSFLWLPVFGGPVCLAACSNYQRINGTLCFADVTKIIGIS